MFDFLKGLFCISSTSRTINFKDSEFTIRKKIGTGGFSNVFLVIDPITDNIYALKQMMVDQNKGKQRAQTELDIYQKFADHPNFIKLYDFESKVYSDGTEKFCFLLKYFPRGSLHDYINLLKESNKFMTEAQILNIFLQVCNGVRAMHESDPQLCHRDLKPHNILLNEDDTPVLIDFGSTVEARSIDILELRADLKMEFQEDALETSTPSYRPPELFDLGGVFSDDVVDERVDIWSLGCVLYAMAYLQNPFDSAILRGGDLKLAVVNGKIDFPNTYYSDEFNNLIKSMINTTSSERPFIQEVISQVEYLIKKENVQ